MDADIHIGEGAKYTYLEKHIHSPQGGIEVIPRAQVELDENARFETHFELLRGRVGKIDIEYETTCKKKSVMEMTAKINGTGDDLIKISETGNLVGEGSRGVLTTRVAVRDEAEADVYNKLIATAPYARGHVDCKEIIQDRGRANAVPVVEVRHPKAHVTHEAAIGSVDTKQLETLMSRGLSEDEAVDLIIEGLLR
jgi:Fe-S cluster assembly scaffold protein SufB